MRLQSVFVAAWMAAAVSAYGWSPGAAADTQVFIGGSRAGSFLGVRLAEINAERARALSLKEEHGAEVTDVDDDSPAARAGLKTGDVILQYNGQRVEGVEQFQRLVRETPAGREVKLGVSRNGSPQTLAVRTGARKGFSFRSGEAFPVEVPNFDLREFHLPDLPPNVLSFAGPRLGIDVHTVNGQLADYFGVKQGVLVSSVYKGSAAERAGMRAGDIILRVDERTIASERDIRAALRSATSALKRSVPVVVSRDKRELTLTVTLEQMASPEQVRVRPLLQRGPSARI
jgi:serine protease Do